MELPKVYSIMPTKIDRNQPIGVFDSGLGGLTVVKELMRQLPKENVVYFGDTARVPYGTKSKESIVKFSKENVAILLKHNVKMVVVACNTSSSLALPVLRRSFPIPIIGVIHPGARRAIVTTRNKKVGVIATPATIASQAYSKTIKKLDRSIKVESQPCPLFVPLAEEGWFEKKSTLDIASEYLKKMKTAKIDTLILGCTHYPLLKGVLHKVMGKSVKLVDSAQTVVGEVKQHLEDAGKARVSKTLPRYKFLVSDQPKHFRKLAKRFLGYNIKNVQRCDHV